jgi:cysteine desulfurase/selenocysteine lyase
MNLFDVNHVRRDFPALNGTVHGKPLVYLDSAATSQKPEVMIKRLGDVYRREYARVEEGHTLSREATKAFEGTRSKVAKLINAAEPREVIFCRGATEALNILAAAFANGALDKGDEILLTEAEHYSNIVPWLLACKRVGARVRAAPVTPEGELDLNKFEKLLGERVRLVGLTHMSNVTGGVFPVKRVIELAHARDIPVLVDGAQAVAHMPVDVRDIGCDFYAGSGHKMGGPTSVGFLYGRANRLEELPPALGGATMAESASFDDVRAKDIPHKYEAGEPAFAEVEAWGAAIDYWNNISMDGIFNYEKALTDYAVERLSSINGVRVLGSPKRRVSIVSFVVDRLRPDEVEKALDEEGIAVRAGTLEALPLLKALGVEEAVRASFMFYNTQEEVDVLAGALGRIARRSGRADAVNA